MRLIDADELLSKAIRAYWGIPNIADRVEALIENAPTVDTVKHGRWVNGQCSECGCSVATDNRRDFLDESDQHYCYNCGAKMDKE